MDEAGAAAVASGTAKPFKSRSAIGRPSGFGRLTPARSMSLGVAAAVVAATVAGFAVTGSSGQTAVAAPAPLKVESSRATVPLATVAKRAAALAGSHGAARRGPTAGSGPWGCGTTESTSRSRCR